MIPILQMKVLLAEIQSLCAIVYGKEPRWRVSEMVLPPAAEPEDIVKLDTLLPYALPPSYRDFLSLHDGCLNLWPKLTLLGTKGEPRDRVFAEVEDARREQAQDAANEVGAVTADSIRAFESQEVPPDTPPYLYIPDHTVIGADARGWFLLIDQGTLGIDGEPQVVLYSYSGRVEARHDSFAGLLTATKDALLERIQTKGYR